MVAERELFIGEWTLLPESNELRRGDAHVHVEPRYVDLLVYLARNAGRVVSADEILENVWSGQVVGGHSVYQAIARLRKALGDSSQQPRYIETVAKRGYRLIAKVAHREDERRDDPTLLGLTGGERESATVESALNAVESSSKAGVPPLRKLAVVVSLAALLAVLTWLVARFHSTTPVYESVAVMPFESLDGDQVSDYFGRGLAAELISDLGHLQSLRVFGQFSSFKLKRGGKSAREIGRILGADALVEGSIRRSGKQLRVSVQIIATDTGYQIWSETFERRLTNIFEIQVDIAQRVADALRGKIEPAALTQKMDTPPVDIEAFDYYLLGKHYENSFNVSGLKRALAMYNKALESSAHYAPAYQGIGNTYLLLSYFGNLSLSQALALASPFLDKAFELDPEDAETLGSIAFGHHLTGEYGLAEHFLDQAMRVNPNYAQGWILRGVTVARQGRLHEALDDLQRAVLLEPLHVSTVVTYARALGWAGEWHRAMSQLKRPADSNDDSAELNRTHAILALGAGDLTTAYESSTASLDGNGEDGYSHAVFALVLAYLGRDELALDSAERAIGEGLLGQGTLRWLEQVYRSTGAWEELEDLAKSEHIGEEAGEAIRIDWRRMNASLGAVERVRSSLVRLTHKV